MQTPNEKRQINHVVTDMINMTVQYFRRIMSTSSAKPVNVKTRKQEMWLRKSAFEKNSINVRYGFQIFAKGELTNFLFFIFGEDRLVQIE